MSDEFDALGLVLDDVGCDGWVVRDLLDEKSCAAAVVHVWPVAVEESDAREVRKSRGERDKATYSPRTGLSGLVDDASK
jgi:hypothetical protein